MNIYISFVLSPYSESPDLRVTKAKDLQSTSTLEQFMSKLCPHHQRQIVDAIGFLQTEVKALASSSTQKASNSTSGIHGTPSKYAVALERSCKEVRFPTESTPKSEVQDVSHSVPIGCSINEVPETAVSLKTSVSAGPALDLRSPGSGSNHALVSPTSNPLDMENSSHGDHAPLKMKIMTSNIADGKKLSCVLNTSISSHSDSLEEQQGNCNSSNRTETHSARLSSSVKRHNQGSHMRQVRQKETRGHTKDTPAKLLSVHMTIPSNSPRTARKTIKTSSDHQTRDSAFRGFADPDFGHCDIVFIDKPITDCFKEQRRSMLPRRNARKSTRGHMYSDEIWELKTVRTLAGRGNCPNPMPELITLVTPKQTLSRPDALPPIDKPFVGQCVDTMNQMSSEESDERVVPGTGDMVEVATSKVDVIVEMSQTDQCQNKDQSTPPSPIRSATENEEMDRIINAKPDTSAQLRMTTGMDECVDQASFEEEKHNLPVPQEDTCKSTEQIISEPVVEPVENNTVVEADPQHLSDSQHNSQSVLQQNIVPSSPSPVNQLDEKEEEKKREELHDEQPQDLQPETQIHIKDNVLEETEKSTGLAEDPKVTEPEIETFEVADIVMPSETEDNDKDVSSKTLDALLKELPPWRRKRGTVMPLPKQLRKTETVIVGYVNGRPISASDRSLRRRSSNSTSPNKNAVNSTQSVPNKTSSDSVIESALDNKVLEKPLTEEPVSIKSIETNSATEQVIEPSSDTPPSPTSKVVKTKQNQKLKGVQKCQNNVTVLSNQPVDHSLSTESTRQLRSASQKPAGSPVSPSTLTAVTSDSSPKSATTSDSLQNPQKLPTEQLPSPPLSSSLPPPSLIRSSSPVPIKHYQNNPDTETTVEFNAENSQPPETTLDEMQNNEVGNRIQTKTKLRSLKDADESNNETQEVSGKVSCLLENQSPVKTETQAQIALRSKDVLRTEAAASDAVPQKTNVASLEDRPAIGSNSSSSISEKPTRMPLRSEKSKADMLHQSVTQSPTVDSKKFALRSQRLASPSTSGLAVTGKQSDPTSPIRIVPERIKKAQAKPSPVSVESVLPHSSAIPVITQRLEPPKQTNKFFETLTGEESQHLITNLNIKYDKMQKGWVQMDKEGQPGTKYKSKADRQAAIWKSKRRTRKPKSSDHQKYSPVQMLFMKGFNLTSICRWFLESTETKSLVIVKKVNTRLPSETQLCFHSSSSGSGTSQGVFPSLQAERLKKHLKKFAIASPVKSNPKSQKLIAKALEQEANAVKGRDWREPSSTIQNLTLSHSSAQACIQVGELQKTSGKSKNPASARILRKYSNIREKMQVQQTNVRLKKVSKALKTNNMKRLTTTNSSAGSSLKGQRSPLPVSKQIKLTYSHSSKHKSKSAAKMERRKTLGSKKNTKHPVRESRIKAQSSRRPSKDATKKELPKRCSQRLGSSKISEHNPVGTSKNKVDNKKTVEAQKAELEKPSVNKMTAAKIQIKESSQTTQAEFKGTEKIVETPQQSLDVKAPTSPDQVLTRSQRKMEAAVPLSGNQSSASKRASKSVTTENTSPKSVRKAEQHAMTRSGTLKSPAKRSQAAMLPRSATKRAQELSETPAKRTRTSLAK